MYGRLKIFAIAGAAIVLAACSGSHAVHTTSQELSNRKPAPNFTLTDANGKRVSLSDFRGKVVLLNFWATWCGPCQLEIPWFVEFEQQLHSKGLQVIGVSMDDDGWPVVKPFIAEHHINYPVLLGNDSVAQLYGGLDALPTTFILDRDGRIAYPPHVGLAGKDEYLHEVESLLQSNPSNASRKPVQPGSAVVLASATN
jgi:peroxiredoxin